LQAGSGGSSGGGGGGSGGSIALFTQHLIAHGAGPFHCGFIALASWLLTPLLESISRAVAVADLLWFWCACRHWRQAH
jgi:hypothetical protein